MQRYAGLTWDHPRGYAALRAAAVEVAPGQRLDIGWTLQPLGGFESHPIADLCARYDLVVLDHPHIGEAVRAGCLRPLESLFSTGELAALERETIGPCFSSYRYAGQHWALPLDAAAQVMAYRPDRFDGPPPATWTEIESLAREGGVALSLAGPHAILSLLSIATGLGDPPALRDTAVLLDAAAGAEACALLARLYANRVPAADGLDPIGILEHMASADDIRLCPLVFGYVNYAAPAPGRRALGFADAPAGPGGLSGATLGGTGIGISTRCAPTAELLDHLRWLLGSEAQLGFIPAHEGQPSRRAAWHDAGINRAWGNFYTATVRTIEAGYVRPRYAGYIAWQAESSALLRAALKDRRGAADVVRALNSIHRQAIGDQER